MQSDDSNGITTGGRTGVRRKKGPASQQQLHVMFTDAHIRELKPGNMGWRKQVIGQGTYGKVYKATVSCCCGRCSPSWVTFFFRPV